MENKGLLFIPDISGFTKFVNQTDIEHSRMIIQELLELLINTNKIGLEISEIEGDAILFYKFGEAPKLEEIYKQVEAMFREFHRHLLRYDQHKYCQCNACLSMVGLSLKVITHYGEFTGYNVKQFSKLIGKDVIVAHQLLKNDIDQHEYWLVTQNLVYKTPPAGFTDWMKWNIGAKQTDSGEIPFHYTQLSELRNEITPEAAPEYGLTEKTKALSFIKEYDTDIITLFHAAGDFNYRNKWFVGVKSVEVPNQHLPRLGMKCKCIMDNEQEVFYSSGYTYGEDRIEFNETDEGKMFSVQYTLEKINVRRTKLTIDVFIKKGLLNKIFFGVLKKKKTEATFNQSLENLSGFVKELKVPSALS
ncbi:MAG: DUF2652 domain-containing protein [Ignavibacteriales bacterium]|nr:MAG: DUF2652 domain-containing protein [Ignavibacteriales bacterium]